MISPVQRYRPNLLMLLGLLMFFWGLGDVTSLVNDMISIMNGKSPSTEEGFSPFLVPVGSSEMIFDDTDTLNDSRHQNSDQLSSGIDATINQVHPSGLIEGSSSKEDSGSESPNIDYGIPTRILIPAIDLDAPIINATYKILKSGAQYFDQWQAPDEYAVGWHNNSALLGEKNNLVLNGHHNTKGEVFIHLVDLVEGDLIRIYSGDKWVDFLVTNKLILPEKYADLPTRIDNAKWILPSDDQRLTLVTCWPYESNTHRLLIVAKPRMGESENAN